MSEALYDDSGNPDDLDPDMIHLFLTTGFPSAEEMNGERAVSDNPRLIYLLGRNDLMLDGAGARSAHPGTVAVARALSCLPDGEVVDSRAFVAAGLLDPTLSRQSHATKLRHMMTELTWPGANGAVSVMRKTAESPVRIGLADNIYFMDAPGRTEYGRPLSSGQRRALGRKMLKAVGAISDIPPAIVLVPSARPERARSHPPEEKAQPLSNVMAAITPKPAAGGDWRHRALCRGIKNPEIFFPIGKTGPAELAIEEAKEVCRRCSVIDDCLEWALESGEDEGVWGGTSEDERRLIRRRRIRQSGR